MNRHDIVHHSIVQHLKQDNTLKSNFSLHPENKISEHTEQNRLV